MVWNTIWPSGTVSVRSNVVSGKQNTQHINDSMVKDHFWTTAEGATAGFHRNIQMPKLVDGATDLAINALTDGGLYVKQVSATITDMELYYTNVGAVPYQLSPIYQTGSKILTTNIWNELVTVPDESYGEIYIMKDSDSAVMGRGYFKAAGGVVHAYTTPYYRSQALATAPPTLTYSMLFKNTDAISDLKIYLTPTVTDTYIYKVLCWGI